MNIQNANQNSNRGNTQQPGDAPTPPDERADRTDESTRSSTAATQADEAAIADQRQEGGTTEQLLEAVVAERDAYHDRWMRATAELENYRKRVQKEAEENRLYGAITLVRDLLPALDNLHRAIAAGKSSSNINDLLQGVEMVAKQIEDVLASHSAVGIDAVGSPFDPNLHEAVQQMPSSEHPPMTVLEEVERGYRLHERVVRPSKVIVSTSPPESSTESAGAND